MSIDATNAFTSWCKRHADGEPSLRRFVLMILANAHRKDTRLVEVTVGHVSEVAGISERWARKMLAALVDDGLLTLVRGGRGHAGGSIYRLNLPGLEQGKQELQSSGSNRIPGVPVSAPKPERRVPVQTGSQSSASNRNSTRARVPEREETGRNGEEKNPPSPPEPDCVDADSGLDHDGPGLGEPGPCHPNAPHACDSEPDDPAGPIIGNGYSASRAWEIRPTLVLIEADLERIWKTIPSKRATGWGGLRKAVNASLEGLATREERDARLAAIRELMSAYYASPQGQGKFSRSPVRLVTDEAWREDPAAWIERPDPAAKLDPFEEHILKIRAMD